MVEDNIIFEYEIKAKNIILENIFFVLFIFGLMFIFLLSAHFFMNLPLLSLIKDTCRYFILFFLYIILFYICIFILSCKKIVFTTDKIKLLNKYVKKLCFEINYEDIEYFIFQNTRRVVTIKTKKLFYYFFCEKEHQSKINEILRSKVSDLLKSNKKQKQMNNNDRPMYLFLTIIIGYVCIFLLLPVTSFFYTKIGDYNLNKFIKSGYTNIKYLNKAENSYWATMNTRAYYNYKQILKINKYTNNKYLKKNAEYVNKLFPSRIEETQSILNSDKIDFQ